VENNIGILQDRGVITYEPRKSRTIKLTESGIKLVEKWLGIDSTKKKRGVPVIGYAGAGELCEISTEPGQIIDVNLELEGKGSSAFIVKGCSMIEAGIFDGAYVFVKKQPRYENGDIVVAFHAEQGLPGGFTLKRFYQEKNYVRLQPANSELQSRRIYADEWSSFDEWSLSWEIQGKVVSFYYKFT